MSVSVYTILCICVFGATCPTPHSNEMVTNGTGVRRCRELFLCHPTGMACTGPPSGSTEPLFLPTPQGPDSSVQLPEMLTALAPFLVPMVTKIHFTWYHVSGKSRHNPTGPRGLTCHYQSCYGEMHNFSRWLRQVSYFGPVSIENRSSKASQNTINMASIQHDTALCH